MRGALDAGFLHRRLQVRRRCEGLGLVCGLEVVRDGHVVRIVDSLINRLTRHSELSPCSVESVVSFTPGRIVGHLRMYMRTSAASADCTPAAAPRSKTLARNNDLMDVSLY